MLVYGIFGGQCRRKKILKKNKIKMPRVIKGKEVF